VTITLFGFHSREKTQFGNTLVIEWIYGVTFISKNRALREKERVSPT